jgi:uncharacterized protein with HEPN domain
MPTERSERLYLADIRDAIDRILTYTEEGRESFLADARTQDAVVRNIEIIGEATRGVSDVTRQAHPAIPWRDMADMRNKIIHDYFRIDLEVVWDVVTNDLRPLREQIDRLLSGFE